MSDIITRLLLKTNDFDANLEKSKGSVNRFQGDISNIAKSVGSSFVKVAGGIGLAVSASESFMKIIRSTQTTSDEFDNTLNACKEPLIYSFNHYRLEASKLSIMVY